MATPAALYLHVPFCRCKCDYCAFYSVARADDADLRRAYLRRISDRLLDCRPQTPLKTVYVGGGNPTCLPPTELAALLAAVRAAFTLADGCEFTVESNPDTLTPETAAVLAGHGVNRVSLGVQSFCPALRRTLGRRGPPDAAGRAVDSLRARDIERLNCDLIYGIPGQTPTQWREDLRQTLTFAPEHVSAYALTLEPGTPLARQHTTSADDDLCVQLWQVAGQVLGAAGLPRYEISNYAAPPAVCRHNVAIWYGAAYYGLGPAATAFDGAVRRQQVADLRAWLQGAAPDNDPLPADARAAEILFCGLRLSAGWRRAQFRQVTGYDYDELRSAAIDQLTADGLLTRTPDTLRPAERGLLFHDHIARTLL